MPAWSLKNGATIGDLDWFLQRLARARALMPSAVFDTALRVEFDETITTQLTDQTGTVAADPETILVRAGVVSVTAGDSGAGGTGTLKLTNPVGEPAAHVQAQNGGGGKWYVAGLSKVIRPSDSSGNTVDGVALRDDDGTNLVAIGLRGPSSATNCVGAALSGGILTTVLGPALDASEAPVWRLFEFWNDQTLIHFALDGIEFSDTIDVANAAGVFGQLAARVTSPAAGFPATGLYEKWTAVVEWMTVGQP